MAKILTTIGIILTIFIVWRASQYYIRTQVHKITVHNESKLSVDSITVYTDKAHPLKHSSLQKGTQKTFQVDISSYKQKEGVFTIKIFQKNFNVTSVFNYHDGLMLPESELFLYDGFIATGKMANPNLPHGADQQKSRLK